jgi:hypothetical protein
MDYKTKYFQLRGLVRAYLAARARYTTVNPTPGVGNPPTTTRQSAEDYFTLREDLERWLKENPE